MLVRLLAFRWFFVILASVKNHPDITADPHVMTGMPCIKGTRVTVANIVRQIAAGRTVDEICRDYPSLTSGSVKAALEFAADLTASETHELLAS